MTSEAYSASPAAAAVARAERPPGRSPARRIGRWLIHWSLPAYATIALVYLLFPIAIIIWFSFNDTHSRFNFVWQGCTLKHWKDPFEVPGLLGALKVLDRDRGDLDGDRHRARHGDGAGAWCATSSAAARR